jgi:hypothetical protein
MSVPNERLREALAQLRDAPLSKYIGPNDYRFSNQDDTMTAMGLGRDLANGIFDAVETALAKLEATLASQEPPNAPTVTFGYCDNHRWLHPQDRGPSLPPYKFPCKNWEPPAAPATREMVLRKAVELIRGMAFYKCPYCLGSSRNKHNPTCPVAAWLEEAYRPPVGPRETRESLEDKR